MRRPYFPILIALLSAVIGISQSTAANGRELKVGPGERFSNPSDAAKVARSGDTIVIAPGIYRDCTIFPARIDGLTVEGEGVTITGRVCGGKALFVIPARNVVIRGITFRGAKARDHNGAGIRSEARNLTIENSTFLNNQNGILTGDLPLSTITIRKSRFEGNGTCIAACAHGIYVNHIKLLHIEDSDFVGQKQGHHVKSRARRTELVGNRIQDGPDGTASYLVDIPNGGDVVITDNTLQKGPSAENHSAAITIGEEGKSNGGANKTSEILVENNRFRNDLPNRTIFVRN